ncbi:MAG: methylmalonyl Co-A mutase-associated GTPase MeaB [Acidimicrobiales bacterium]
MPSRDPAELIDRASAGDRVALARLLTLIERGGEAGRAAARLAHRRSGQAYTVGITGAPGAGKSTLTDALLHHVRADGLEVGVLAVDPSSPRTGGAILGDRVRMTGHAGDEGVFIRSMASRGHLGGLALVTLDAGRVLDAAGLPIVVVETVGVGQVEVAIAAAADTTVVVVTPGWGDAVQASKAGLIEVADVLVVNKADRRGAEAAAQDLEGVLHLVAATSWRPPVVVTCATDGRGVADLWDAILRHRAALESSGDLARRRHDRAATELRQLLLHRLEARAATTSATFDALVDQILSRHLDPWSAADTLLDRPRPPSA